MKIFLLTILTFTGLIFPAVQVSPDPASADRQLLLADPTIFLDKGTYYLYGTSSDSGFLVYQSADLKNWSGPVGRSNGFALLKGQSFGTKGFWAPQVFKYKNTYYMAYTADEQIAIATSDHPLGPFKQQEMKPVSGSGKQIDPFIFYHSGKFYLYHVKLQNGNRIFVTEMKSDLSDISSGIPIPCISGSLSWENTENTGWPVTEGPTVIYEKGLFYMIYSANDFRSKDYAVGYATATNPLGPWKKYAGSPIISRQNLTYNGTGHGDLFKDKTGRYQYVLHTHNSMSRVSPRMTALVGMSFDKNGKEDEVLKADDSSFRFLSLMP